MFWLVFCCKSPLPGNLCSAWSCALVSFKPLTEVCNGSCPCMLATCNIIHPSTTQQPAAEPAPAAGAAPNMAAPATWDAHKRFNLQYVWTISFSYKTKDSWLKHFAQTVPACSLLACEGEEVTNNKSEKLPPARACNHKTFSDYLLFWLLEFAACGGSAPDLKLDDGWFMSGVAREPL